MEMKRQQEEARREARRIARETAAQWSTQFKDDSSGGEDRKPRRKSVAKKPRSEGEPSGDEAAPKRKRGPRRKKNVDEDGDEPMTGEPSADEAPKQPKKVIVANPGGITDANRPN